MTKTIYIVDTDKWTCTCSVGITGFPSGEPCKHQHAVANKYTLNSPPFFSARGRYLHAVIALREERAGTQAFYANLQEDNIAVEDSASASADSTAINELHTPASNSDSDDSAADNLDCLINILREKDNSEKDNLVQTVSQLCYSFVEDVCKRTKQMDTQYLLGLQKFLLFIWTLSQALN